jgi:hypothetical protein
VVLGDGELGFQPAAGVLLPRGRGDAGAARGGDAVSQRTPHPAGPLPRSPLPDKTFFHSNNPLSYLFPPPNPRAISFVQTQQARVCVGARAGRHRRRAAPEALRAERARWGCTSGTHSVVTRSSKASGFISTLESEM